MTTTSENRECGIRHRFRVRYRDRVPNRYPREMEELLLWCQAFDEEGLAPVEGGASAGNLSFRTPSGFVITPTRSRLKTGISWTTLVEVVRSDWRQFEIHVLGERAPSSDSFLHERIYAHRPDVMAVFHGHNDVILRQAESLKGQHEVAVTGGARSFGTPEDAEETAREIGQHNAIIRLGHGFVTAGRTQKIAGDLALALHRAALAFDAPSSGESGKVHSRARSKRSLMQVRSFSPPDLGASAFPRSRPRNTRMRL